MTLGHHSYRFMSTLRRSVLGIVVAAGQVVSAASVDFSREVFPIFQRACIECHGPVEQKGKLRLDSREPAFKGGENGPVFVPGQSAKSEMVRRITLAKGHDDVMPNRGEPLSPSEISRIKAWIDAGAVWPEDLEPAQHWAYVKPVKPALPPVATSAWPRNEIDHFILSRIEQEGLRPSPEADRARLVRRVHLDLIGLPPSPAEVAAFVNDASPKAYEHLVDRLLASPQFGVRWARPWLDYARYADSHGFQRDDFRDLWPYRDWVVEALNAGMPYDQFTVEQIAGDLLPNATEAQKIATGFNRSAPTNVEAGTDPEETRVNQIHDRINTLGMIWLGSTLECAQCHDHKYDPISQRDYYGLFAFFNQTELEADRTNPNTPGSIQFKGPVMELTDAETQAEREQLQAKINELKRQMAALETAATQDLATWEKDIVERIATAPQEHLLEVTDFESTGGATDEIQPDGSVLLSGEPAPDKDTYVIQVRTKLTGIRALKLEALAHDSLPGKGPGRGDATRPNFVLNDFTATAAPLDQPAAARPVVFKSATASFSQSNFPVTNLLQSGNGPRGGWAINPRFHESHWALLETAGPVGEAGGTVLTFRLEQNYGGGRTIGNVRLSAITGNVGAKPLPATLARALEKPVDKRTAKEKQAILAFRLEEEPGFAKLEQAKTALEAKLNKVKPPTTLVMREIEEPRMSTVFQRGEFRNPGEKIEPAVPVALHALHARTADASPSRLDLARWLVDAQNPLAARVTVNRWWGELFGHGLVTTPEDFGIKGDRPTHPELLDWLAVEFMDKGWSMKHMLKLMVMSATYQQSAVLTTELAALDDRNLFYARGARFRMDAEMIRDNALAVAGLLSLEQGGEPIRPYQPDGLWIKVGGQRYDYVVSPGEEQYRRGLYVVWKRGAPYPSFVNFDANSRMACRVKRPRSNTPLQALTLMNDPVYVEAAMAFARRIVTEQPQPDVEGRIQQAFQIAVSRNPAPAEIATLKALYESQRDAAAADAKGTKEFVGKFALPKGITQSEFVAWYAVATALLNLDETISKG